MIERNLGNAERTFRLIAGVTMFTWIVTRPQSNGLVLIVALIPLFLILNGVFSRCYLWFILNLNTHKSSKAGDGTKTNVHCCEAKGSGDAKQPL